MITVYGRRITEDDLDIIATYMDDEKREQVHAELSPCDPETFLNRYLELGDQELEDILKREFHFRKEYDNDPAS